MRLDINDRWYMDGDATSVTLVEIVPTEAGRLTKSENVGKPRDINRGYFATVRDALYRYMEISVRRDLEATDVRGLLAAMDERLACIAALAAKVAPHMDAPAKRPSTTVQTPLPDFTLRWSDLSAEARAKLLAEAGVAPDGDGPAAQSEPEEIVIPPEPPAPVKAAPKPTAPAVKEPSQAAPAAPVKKKRFV